MKNVNNFFFSYDFFPKIGGAHLWLYEVAKNWPEYTLVITSCFSNLLSEQIAFDSRFHGAITAIHRYPFQITSMGIDWNFFKNSFKLLKFFRNNYSKSMVIHSLRAIPETVSIFPIKFFLKKK